MMPFDQNGSSACTGGCTWDRPKTRMIRTRADVSIVIAASCPVKTVVSPCYSPEAYSLVSKVRATKILMCCMNCLSISAIFSPALNFPSNGMQ